MTIAAAFQCAEGYVLCADSLMSHGSAGDVGTFGNYEPKVFLMDEETYSSSDYSTRVAAMCGAGNDGALLHPFSEAFFENLASDTDRKVREVVTQTLENFAEKLNSPPSMQLLIATMEPGEGLIKTDGLIVSPARQVEVFGIGENSLVRFLIDTLHDPHHGSLEETVVLAAFVVAAAKKYCPQYCGGETHIAEFSIWQPWPRFIDLETIKNIETAFWEKGKAQLKSLTKEAAKLVKSSF